MTMKNENSNSEGQSANSRQVDSNVLDEPKPSPQPHQDQLRYWKRDLLFKLISLAISILGFALIVKGLRVNSQQLAINAEQLRLNTAQSLRTEKSMCSNVQITVLNHVVNLDRLFMDKSYLRPYFYDGKEVAKTDEKYDELSATSEMVLDIFDLVADQSRKNPECWDRPKLWDEWIIDTFSTSPILRDTLGRYSSWYEDPLMGLRDEGRRRLEEKPKHK